MLISKRSNELFYATASRLEKIQKITLQSAIHILNVISKDYNMRISIDKTKVLALRGKDPIRIRIVITERIIDQVLNFNYYGYNTGLNREMVINVKLQISTHMWYN
jgi:hypothetical protein